MNFNFPLLRPVRMLLFPLSLIYFFIIWLRNKLYDAKMMQAASFNLPIICVGNLAVGGTGKSPMVEYLLRLLKKEFAVATLSRGYKRKTKGYALANASSTALEIGDEPMQFYTKFPDVAVAVGERRLEAIPQLLHDHPETKAIILDDAFQHRAVSAGFNILLTDYNNLFSRDWYMPSGDLRDQRSSAKRADVIVVTKCSPSLSWAKKKAIVKEVACYEEQQVFFSAIHYGTPYHIITKKEIAITEDTEVLLVTGIANPLPLKKMLTEQAATYYEMAYNDHHIFRIDDLKEMVERFQEISAANKIIITTEKDAVRLTKFESELADLPFYVLPVEHEFLFDEGPRFNNLIQHFVRNFK